MAPPKTAPQPRVIGPYAVRYDTPGVGDGFVPLAPLPAGTLILRAWLFTTADWNTAPAGDGHQMYISLGQGSGALTAYPNVPSDTPRDAEPVGPNDAKPSLVQRVPAGGASLSIEVYPGQGAFVSGAANVYALILDPA